MPWSIGSIETTIEQIGSWRVISVHIASIFIRPRRVNICRIEKYLLARDKRGYSCAFTLVDYFEELMTNCIENCVDFLRQVT